MRDVSRTISLIILALGVAMIGSPAWSEESAAKADKELAVQGERIDKAAAPADSSRVTARIVDQWAGTNFRFDAASAPRPLTAEDIQNLRAKGLGYGEISILLALTANQPNPATAKPMSDILALRQSGKGWGEIAPQLGYKNLGSAMNSIKATEKGVVQVAKPLSPEEQKKAAELQAEADRLNAKATAASSTPEGNQKLVTSLAKEFKVQESTIIMLREQKKLGFGEIVIVLGLAQEAAKRDKISIDVATNRIMARRDGGGGWGEIAHDLDLKLGNVVSDMKKADKLVVAIQKPGQTEPTKGEKPGVGAPEKIEKPVKPERVERPERVEKPGKL